MREKLLNSLQETEEFNWEESEARALLLGIWSAIKWIAIGLLAIMAWIVFLIFSIVFGEVNERTR